jgi:hypothetical protein
MHPQAAMLPLPGGIVDCIDCNPVPPGIGNRSRRDSFKKRLTSADSGFQLDLEIALSGFPAKVQPHELFSPAEDTLKRRVT